MNYSGHFCLLVCSIAVVVIAFAWPFITAHLPESERRDVPIWAVLGGLTFATYSGLQVRAIDPGYDRVLYSFILTSVLFFGVFVKCLFELVAQKKLLLREAPFCGSLLAAPLLNIVGPKLFPGVPTPAVCLVWFFNGYFWYSLLSDCERMFIRESVIIRRREPPTLYSDFRKPEVRELD